MSMWVDVQCWLLDLTFEFLLLKLILYDTSTVSFVLSAGVASVIPLCLYFPRGETRVTSASFKRELPWGTHEILPKLASHTLVLIRTQQAWFTLFSSQDHRLEQADVHHLIHWKIIIDDLETQTWSIAAFEFKVLCLTHHGAEQRARVLYMS